MCADSEEIRQQYIKQGRSYKWKPSIHMPKAACRLWLKVKAVRVERLRDISEEDAKAEGAKAAPLPDLGNTWHTHKQGFEYLWQSINGAQSFLANPWVWVIEFERCEKPDNFLPHE